ncbi:MAG: 3-hydroxybutyryl-CoA dehydrogenase, partial [Rhodocyclaceae bacterium]|nr:3-hydroxybutyryl-CoA dehydrogenase [Rhodocyclaceae bacterium]
MDIKKVGVVGAGTMGNGIAQVFAVAGFEVLLTDISTAALERATHTISGSLDRLIKKDKMSAEQKAA